MKTFNFAFIAKMRPVNNINHEKPTKTDLKTLDYLQSLTDFIINLDPKKEPRNINTKGGDPEPTLEQKNFYSELKNNKELLEALCVYIPKAQTTYTMREYSGMAMQFWDFGVKNYPPYTSLDFGYIYYGIIQILNATREAYLIYFNEALQKKVKKLEEQKSKKKKGFYNVPGHLKDQALKYNYPKAPDLFSHYLQEETIQKIDQKGVERSKVVEGIKLDPAEIKIVDTLCKMLHQKSQNLNPKAEDYYTGNEAALEIQRKGEILLAPQLTFTLYEFTKEYLDTDRKIGGKDIENIQEALYRLSTKDFLIKYKETTKIKGGGTREREIEFFDKIINLPKIREKIKNIEGLEISKTEQTLVTLHPIFRSQINSKFITYPADINSRTCLAYGSPNVSLVTLNLRDYLMRSLSAKTYTTKITAERLYWLVHEKFMKESRKARVKKDLEKAIQALMKLELLKSYEIEPSKTTGEPMYIFIINKDFS